MNKNQEFNLELKIGLFGNGGVGKTTIIIRFLRDIFVKDYDPTIEEDFKKIIDLNYEKIIFNILDTSGSEDHSVYIQNWTEKCDLFVLVYSITSKSSFNDILFCYHKNIDKIKKDYPKILIGNKSDLFTKREVKTKEGKELAKKLNCKYIETSAKTGENVYQLFYEVFNLKNQNNQNNQNENKNYQNNQNYQNKNKKGKCLLM